MVMKIPAFARVPTELPNQPGQRGLGCFSVSSSSSSAEEELGFCPCYSSAQQHATPLQHLQSWVGEMRDTRVTQPTSKRTRKLLSPFQLSPLLLSSQSCLPNLETEPEILVWLLGAGLASEMTLSSLSVRVRGSRKGQLGPEDMGLASTLCTCPNLKRPTMAASCQAQPPASW